ncbi:TIGR02285 family protein [Bdellovibrio bacteriovorus]|uniref:TIGR02285 family protein n=1 Tax=Bdellovibrio bacteriovorus TaxID=959 RepID=UPI003D02AA46
MLLTSVFFALLLSVGLAQPPLMKTEKITVPWAVTDWEPYYIQDGPNASMGRVDRLRRILEEHLKEYQLTDVRADMSKTTDLWKMEKNVCSGSALITPEREQWAYFTALSFQVPLEYVLVTASTKVLDGLPAEVSLKDLMKDKMRHGVFVKDRSYGPEIDRLLKEVSARGDRHLTLKKSVTDGYTTLLKMVEKKRFDYMIEYEAVVRAYNEKIFPAKPLLTKAVKESRPSAVFHLACTKNSWGRDVVRKVDQLLQKIALTNEYQRAVESWLDPDLQKKNRKLLDEFYQKRAQGPWMTVPQ